MLWSVLLATAIAGTACGPAPRDDRPRKRPAQNAERPDSFAPAAIQQAFEPPANWEAVRLSRGLRYSQPPGFGLGLSDATLAECDSTTTGADTPVFDRAISDRWPLTLALRRGDVNRMARANGFVLDSMEIAAIGQHAGDSVLVRRGEGWMLASGRTTSNGAPLEVLFGTVRYPGGCYLVLAARGVDISVDTLGMVLSTIRYSQ